MCRFYSMNGRTNEWILKTPPNEATKRKLNGSNVVITSWLPAWQNRYKLHAINHRVHHCRNKKKLQQQNTKRSLAYTLPPRTAHLHINWVETFWYWYISVVRIEQFVLVHLQQQIVPIKFTCDHRCSLYFFWLMFVLSFFFCSTII